MFVCFFPNLAIVLLHQIMRPSKLLQVIRPRQSRTLCALCLQQFTYQPTAYLCKSDVCVCMCVCVGGKDLNVHTLRVGVNSSLCSSLKDTVGLSLCSPQYFPSPLVSLSFLYTVLSQQPVGTVSHPFSVCTAKCFYQLASGYAFPSLHYFSLPTLLSPFLGLCSLGLSHIYKVRLFRHARESCKNGVKMP